MPTSLPVFWLRSHCVTSCGTIYSCAKGSSLLARIYEQAAIRGYHSIYLFGALVVGVCELLEESGGRSFLGASFSCRSSAARIAFSKSSRFDSFSSLPARS